MTQTARGAPGLAPPVAVTMPRVKPEQVLPVMVMVSVSLKSDQLCAMQTVAGSAVARLVIVLLAMRDA
jgi:hypothetical protein